MTAQQINTTFTSHHQIHPVTTQQDMATITSTMAKNNWTWKRITDTHKAQPAKALWRIISLPYKGVISNNRAIMDDLRGI